MNVIAIRPEQVDIIWDEISDYLAGALEYNLGESSLDRTRQRIANGEELLLLVLDESRIVAAVTAELVDDLCNIVLAGGHGVEKWQDMIISSVRKLASEQGAKRLTITGRKGWAKRLRSQGFRTALVTLEATL